MPERAAVFEGIQIGVETTPGTSVAANKKLTALSIEPSPNAEIAQFAPMGSKHNTITALGKEWVLAALAGKPTFTEIVYPLSSVITTPVITTPGGGTTSRDWTFTPAGSAADTPKTFTVEAGSSLRAHKFTHGMVDEFTLAFNRGEVDLSGSLFGQALTDGITLTASPTTIALTPVLAKQFSVYVDATAGGLGTTKLLRVIDGEFKIGSRFGQVWPVDAAQASFAAYVEIKPEVTLRLSLAADAAGMAYLTNMRNATRSFIRVEAIGAVIEAAITYKLRIDMAGEVINAGGFKVSDGLYVVDWTWSAMEDSGWGKAYQVVVTNTLTAL